MSLAAWFPTHSQTCLESRSRLVPYPAAYAQDSYHIWQLAPHQGFALAVYLSLVLWALIGVGVWSFFG